MEWLLFAFLPLSSPSASRGVDPALPGAAEVPRGVEVGRGVEAEGREGRVHTSSAPLRSRRRLWAILMVVSSAGGSVASTSISAGAPRKAGAEARTEEGLE